MPSGIDTKDAKRQALAVRGILAPKRVVKKCRRHRLPGRKAGNSSPLRAPRAVWPGPSPRPRAARAARPPGRALACVALAGPVLYDSGPRPGGETRCVSLRARNGNPFFRIGEILPPDRCRGHAFSAPCQAAPADGHQAMRHLSRPADMRHHRVIAQNRAGEPSPHRCLTFRERATGAPGCRLRPLSPQHPRRRDAIRRGCPVQGNRR